MKGDEFPLINNISVIPTEIMLLFMFMLGKFIMALRMGNGIVMIKGERTMVIIVRKDENVAWKFLTVLNILMKERTQNICLK